MLKSDGRRGLGGGLMLVYFVFVLVLVFVFVGLSLFLRLAFESGDSCLLFWNSIALLNFIVFSCVVLNVLYRKAGVARGHVKKYIQCGPWSKALEGDRLNLQSPSSYNWSIFVFYDLSGMRGSCLVWSLITALALTPHFVFAARLIRSCLR